MGYLFKEILDSNYCRGETYMPGYDIEIHKLLKEGKDGSIKTEIWTKITDKQTYKTISKRIFWEDDDGVYHDETPSLPAELRGRIDNVWIEKSRKW